MGLFCGEEVGCCWLFVGGSRIGCSEAVGFLVTTCSSEVAVKSTTCGLPWLEVEEGGIEASGASMFSGWITGGWKGWSAGNLLQIPILLSDNSPIVL